jgi:hypothetical protein
MIKYLLPILLVISTLQVHDIPAQQLSSQTAKILSAMGIFGSVVAYSARQYWEETTSALEQLKIDMRSGRANLNNKTLSINLMQGRNATPDQMMQGAGWNPHESIEVSGNSRSSFTGKYDWDVKATPNNNLLTFLLKKDDILLVEKKCTGVNTPATFDTFNNECTTILIWQMRKTAFKNILSYTAKIFALGMGSALFLNRFFWR